MRLDLSNRRLAALIAAASLFQVAAPKLRQSYVENIKRNCAEEILHSINPVPRNLDPDTLSRYKISMELPQNDSRTLPSIIFAYDQGKIGELAGKILKSKMRAHLKKDMNLRFNISEETQAGRVLGKLQVFVESPDNAERILLAKAENKDGLSK